MADIQIPLETIVHALGQRDMEIMMLRTEVQQLKQQIAALQAQGNGHQVPAPVTEEERP